MIRARNAINPSHACHSADVLTGPEREADRVPRDFAKPEVLVYREASKKWGDMPDIRAVLEQLRGRL